MTPSSRANYAAFQLFSGTRLRIVVWLIPGSWRRTRGLRPQSLAFYQQYLLPDLLHHLVVGFKGRRREELHLVTYVKDSTTILHYGYGTSAPMVFGMVVLWFLFSGFSPYLRLVSFPLVSCCFPSLPSLPQQEHQSRVWKMTRPRDALSHLA